MSSELLVDVVQRLPQALVSRAWGWAARRRRPRLLIGALKRLFVTVNGIDMSESGQPLDAFACVEDLFVRHLKHGARPIDSAPTSVVSPVDGTVGACGTIENDTLVQAKGRTYSLARLLDDATEAARYEGGSYATFYLAPKDYHRVHSPVAGEVRAARLVPGALMPVFGAAVDAVDELFARNERLVTYVDSEAAGRVAVVKVGATLVGRITVTYDREVQTNRAGQTTRQLDYDPPRPLGKGEELGSFELGSTVVMLCEKAKVELSLEPGDFVRMGEAIGAAPAVRASPPRAKRSGRRKVATKGASARR